MISTTCAAPTQSYHERLPRPEVGGLVVCTWVQQIGPSGPMYEHRTVPDGAVEVSCVLDTGVIRVAGPKRSPVVARIAPGTTVVGLRLRPGAARAVLGPAISELVDHDVDVDQMWGRSAVALGERLAEAASAEEAARRLELEIATRWAEAEEPDALVAQAVRRLQPWQDARVGSLASELFISPRQLRRRFDAALGYGPKTLQRILRFQGFLAVSDTASSRGHASGTTLAHLARLAGYTDQAHLSRECSALSGLTPSAFLDETRRSCGPSHDHAASMARLRGALLRCRGGSTFRAR